MRNFSYIFIVLGCFMASTAPPGVKAFQDAQGAGPPEIISRVTALEMVDLLRGFGWESEIIEDNEGDPDFVRIEFNDYSSWLIFKDCLESAPPRCSTLLFFANFDLGRRILPSDPEIMNKYNDTKVIGRAYFLKKPEQESDQIGIDFRISLAGGVTREHLTLESRKWESAIDTFVENFHEEQ